MAALLKQLRPTKEFGGDAPINGSLRAVPSFGWLASDLSCGTGTDYCAENWSTGTGQPAPTTLSPSNTLSRSGSLATDSSLGPALLSSSLPAQLPVKPVQRPGDPVDVGRRHSGDYKIQGQDAYDYMRYRRGL